MHLVNEFTLLIKQFYYQDQIQIVENQNIDALRMNIFLLICRTIIFTLIFYKTHIHKTFHKRNKLIGNNICFYWTTLWSVLYTSYT